MRLMNVLVLVIVLGFACDSQACLFKRKVKTQCCTPCAQPAPVPVPVPQAIPQKMPQVRPPQNVVIINNCGSSDCGSCKKGLIDRLLGR